MALITNEAEFIGYIKRMLGYPVINVEVADVNISDCIWDSVSTFHRYNYGEGNVRDALFINLSAGVSAYQLPDNIDSVIDIQLSQSQNSINTLFSPQHTLLYNDWVTQGNYIGNQGSTGAAGLGGAMNMGNYFIQMTYLKEIEDTFTRKYICDLNPNTKVVTIKPTPNIDTLGMVFVNRKEDAINLYNNLLVKQLAIAKTKIIWGRNLSKYNSINIPGSGSINGENIRQEGLEQEKEIIENIRLESEPPIFMVG